MDPILSEQIDYYRARAGEYDDWWERTGRYDRGSQENEAWFAEIRTAKQLVAESLVGNDVLELAGGTGNWTEFLAPKVESLTVVDASPEVIEINRHKVQDPKVRYLQADLFEWRPEQTYDAVFFSFWLSHVPPDKFESFWATVWEATKPGGVVIFLDSRRDPRSTARDHILPETSTIFTERKLNDGSSFTIYKLFYDPAGLAENIRSLGWDAEIRTTGKFFLLGVARRR
jgi:demethylmenaquinone methyltransferase/2-methoxy-6-polyprenyl-1,4-benzoquinol methylase